MAGTCRSLTTLGAVAALAWPAQGKSPTSIEDVSPMLGALLDDAASPGVAAAVARDIGLIAEGASGVRRVGGDAPIQIDDRFHVGTCAKAMSASLLGLLIRDELMRWDMTLVEALPRLNEVIDPGFREGTLLELARDRAGVAALAHGNEPIFAQLCRIEGSGVSQRRELTRLALSATPEAGGFVYSNASVPVAVAIAESWSGLNWEELMAARLFEPLGMTSAGFGWPASADRPNQPRGHVPTSEGLRPLPLSAPPVLPQALAPAGEVHCSASDLALFGAWHLAGLRGAGRDENQLDEDAFRLMHDPTDQGYAMGWIPRERGERLITSTMGTTGTFFALLIVDAPRNVCVSVCANSGGAQELCERIAQRLLDEFGPID